MPNLPRQKLSLPTIAQPSVLWYHVCIQVDCAYSTFPRRISAKKKEDKPV